VWRQPSVFATHLRLAQVALTIPGGLSGSALSPAFLGSAPDDPAIFVPSARSQFRSHGARAILGDHRRPDLPSSSTDS
ncbi:MAG: hypothetical protein ACLP7Q_12300, partial [Isosphaeraceae bacterium]